MPLLRAILLGAAALAAAGCNPYDPNLGDTPFRCGTSEPLCPDGYTCVEYSAAERLCELSGGPVADGGGNGDGSPLQCGADAEIEPNESISDPFITPIPDLADDYDMIGLAICPEADIDVFLFRIDVALKNARIEVNYDSGQGTLLVDMINSAGVSIGAATPTGGDPNKLRIDRANLALGEYYAQVKGMGGVRAAYAIKIVTTTGTLPP